MTRQPSAVGPASGRRRGALGPLGGVRDQPGDPAGPSSAAVIGALNLFTTGQRPLNGNDLAVVQGLADIATIGLLHERAVRDQVTLSEQLQTALHSRILVEQAKGVLAAQAGTSVEAAFTLMRTHARRTGQPLTTVAGAIVAGRVDGSALQQAAASFVDHRAT
jgi:hypothetical protein